MNLRRLKDYLPRAKGVIGINARNLELIYAHNRRRWFPNVDDKLLCKRLLTDAGIPVLQTYHVVSGPRTLASWQQALEGIDAFVVKPSHGYGGTGIMLVHRNSNSFSSGREILQTEDITHHALQICSGAFSLDNTSETAYFEEMVFNDPDLRPFISEEIEGIADIRLIFQGDTPVMAMIRIPTIESRGKANLHQGAIGIGIELDTGLTVDGCYRNRVIDSHPDTGRSLRGQAVPHFNKMLDLGARISAIVGLGYIGVDFACDYRYGPVVLEVNARPGLNIQIANQCGLGRRIR